MSNFEILFNRLQKSCGELSTQTAQKKVLNSRFKISGKHSPVGELIRRIVLAIPVVNLLFRNYVALTNPKDVAKTLVKFSQKHTLELNSTQWILLNKALQTLKRSTISPDTLSKIKVYEEIQYAFCKQKLSTELAAKLTTRVDQNKQDLIQTYLTQMNRAELQTTLMNFSDEQVDQLAAKINQAPATPPSSPPTPPPSSSPSPTPPGPTTLANPSPTPTAPTTTPTNPTQTTSVIDPSLPQNIYCFIAYNDVECARKKFKNRFPGIEFIDRSQIDLGGTNEPCKIKGNVHFQQPCQIVVLIPFGERVDLVLYPKLCKAFLPHCNGHLVVSTLQRDSCVKVDNFYKEDFGNIKEFVSGQYHEILDNSGMGKPKTDDFCEEETYFTQLIAAFNKKIV